MSAEVDPVVVERAGARQERRQDNDRESESRDPHANAASLAVARDTSGVEPMAFLRQHHPFSELDDDGLAAVRTALTIVHVPAGDAILTEGGAPADAVGLIRKGSSSSAPARWWWISWNPVTSSVSHR